MVIINYEIKAVHLQEEIGFLMSKIVGVFYQQVNREIHSVRIIKIKRNYTIQEIKKKKKWTKRKS
jgi:hypothetical protein